MRREGNTMIDKIGVETYIEWLGQQWELETRNRGLDIPGPVFDWFCNALVNGDIDLGDDISPNVVIRKLAEESDYGPIEGYDTDEYLRHLLQAGRELYAKGNGEETPDDEALRQYIRAHREDCMEHSGLDGSIEFWYRDDDSEYGISITLDLRY